jgi:hypothetical protein
MPQLDTSLFEPYEPTSFDRFAELLGGYQVAPDAPPAVAGIGGFMQGLNQASAIKRNRAEQQWINLQRQMAIADWQLKQEEYAASQKSRRLRNRRTRQEIEAADYDVRRRGPREERAAQILRQGTQALAQGKLNLTRTQQDIDKAEAARAKLAIPNTTGPNLFSIPQADGSVRNIHQIVGGGAADGMYGLPNKDDPTTSTPLTTAQVGHMLSAANSARSQQQRFDINQSYFQTVVEPLWRESGFIENDVPPDQVEGLRNGITQAMLTQEGPQFRQQMGAISDFFQGGGLAVELVMDPVSNKMSEHILKSATEGLSQANRTLKDIKQTGFDAMSKYGLYPGVSTLMAKKPDVRTWTDEDLLTHIPAPETRSMVAGQVRLIRQSEIDAENSIERNKLIIEGHRQEGRATNIYDYDSRTKSLLTDRSALSTVMRVWDRDFPSTMNPNDAVRQIQTIGITEFGYREMPEDYIQAALWDHPRIGPMLQEQMGVAPELGGRQTPAGGGQAGPTAALPSEMIPPEMLEQMRSDAETKALRPVALDEVKQWIDTP